MVKNNIRWSLVKLEPAVDSISNDMYVKEDWVRTFRKGKSKDKNPICLQTHKNVGKEKGRSGASLIKQKKHP